MDFKVENIAIQIAVIVVAVLVGVIIVTAPFDISKLKMLLNRPLSEVLYWEFMVLVMTIGFITR